MFLTKSPNSIAKERKCKRELKKQYYTPTSYSSIKKSNPQKVSGFIKPEDFAPVVSYDNKKSYKETTNDLANQQDLERPKVKKLTR